MIEKLHLQPRLHLLADLVPQAPSWPILERITVTCRYICCKRQDRFRHRCRHRPAPLEHARRTARQYGVEDDMRFLCCDGLQGIGPEDVDTVVVAGMGGETIIHILSQASWTKAGSTLLLLQPMTKQEDLRRWLNENGYAQCAERLVQDKEYLYPIFTVYGGPQPPLSVAEIYGGVDIEVDPLAREYLTQRIRRLEQAEQGLAKSSAGENHLQSRELGRIKQALIERRAQL